MVAFDRNLIERIDGFDVNDQFRMDGVIAQPRDEVGASCQDPGVGPGPRQDLNRLVERGGLVIGELMGDGHSLPLSARCRKPQTTQ